MLFFEILVFSLNNYCLNSDEREKSVKLKVRIATESRGILACPSVNGRGCRISRTRRRALCPPAKPKSRELPAPGGRSLNGNPTTHSRFHPAVFGRHQVKFRGRSLSPGSLPIVPSPALFSGAWLLLPHACACGFRSVD